MAVGTWALPNYLTQSGSVYPLTLDGNMAVAQRVVAPFAPYPATPAAMTVNLFAGALFVAGALVEVAAQSVTIGAAPGSNSRIDRIVIDEQTGVASVVAGTAAASPAAPAIPAGSLPIARVLIAAGVTAIAATMITDERVPFVGNVYYRSQFKSDGTASAPVKYGTSGELTAKAVKVDQVGNATAAIASISANADQDATLNYYSGTTLKYGLVRNKVDGNFGLWNAAVSNWAWIVPASNVVEFKQTPTVNGKNLIVEYSPGVLPTLDGSRLTGVGYATGQTLSAPSRSLGVIYQNTSSKPIEVMISSYYGSSTFITSIAKGPTAGSLITVLQGGLVNNNGYCALSTVIPPGWYYQVNINNGYLAFWYELS